MRQARREGSRPLRVLLMATRFDGGGLQRHVLDLAAGLRHHGYEIVLAGTPGIWLPAGAPGSLALPLADISENSGNPVRRAQALVAAVAVLRRWLRHRPVD